MIYGAEAMLLAKIRVEIAHALAYTLEESTIAQIKELDLVKGK